MFKKLDDIEKKYMDIQQTLADPNVVSDHQEYQKHMRALRAIEEVVEKYREYKDFLAQLRDTREMAQEKMDEDMRGLVQSELEELDQKIASCEEELKVLLLPRDPNDEKDVILEIRAGTGGDEATLFAADLFRMYSRFAEREGMQISILSSHPTGVGGYKEIIANIVGRGAYSRLKYESGVHRVQRVPETESSGRIHTSAVTVAVMPEADEVDIEVEAKDLRIDTYCSSGPGGQSVNTTYSAVRITHLPTGLVVTCQDEKSQIKNRARAMKVLRSRLLALEEDRQRQEIAQNRRIMVGTGDRSEKIRTYNFPQNRVTDHRIGLTLHKLDIVLEGALDEIIHALVAHFQAEKLKEASTLA